MVRRREFYYGWVIVAVTALTLLVAAGVRSAPGVFLVPMLPEFGNDRGTLSFAASLGIFLFGFGAPLGGWLMDRFGPKRLMLAGTLLVVVSMLLSWRMEGRWELNLFWGALSGIGTGLSSAVLGATVANRWFVQKRGLVTGIFGASTSAGQLIFILLLAELASWIGWRTSILILAIAAAVTLIPALLLMRDSPAEIGLKPYGADPDAPAVAAPAVKRSSAMSAAVRSPTFWLLAGSFFICGFTSNGLIGVHFIPYAVDCGIGQTVAAGYLSLMGVFNFIGTIGSGYLTDRYDPRKLLAVYYSFRGISLILLPFITNKYGLVFFAILFGLDYIATVPPTIALAADTFGREKVGTVYGWIFCAHQIGAALAAWAGGVARDTFGDYVLAFVVAGVVGGVGALLALGIARGPARLTVKPAGV